MRGEQDLCLVVASCEIEILWFLLAWAVGVDLHSAPIAYFMGFLEVKPQIYYYYFLLSQRF
jgi:hypothetical protein